MTTGHSPQISKVERDPRLFFWFMTLIVAGFYVATLYQAPSMREWANLVPFTLLVLVHIFLHWQLESIAGRPNLVFWYMLIQGGLALVICWMANQIGLTFALFMALIGEAIGLLRLTRQGVLAVVYYLILMAVSAVQSSGRSSLVPLLLGTIPMLIFVIIYVTLYMRQNEARERAQSLAAELEQANRQLSEYAAQVEDLTIANERQRIARELHDTLSQGLAGLILQLEAADAHLSNNHQDKARDIISNAMSQARLTLADARHAIDDLRQFSADDLDSALRLEVSRFTNATGIPILVQADQTSPLPAPVKEALVRVFQESLSNIANHAKAHNVQIKMLRREDSLSVTIQDDGQGFDAAAIPAGHYGILGMKERVHLIRGRLDIQSTAGKGTTLHIEIPL